MAVKCSEVIELMEQKYPLSLCESYDNSGFLVGDRDAVINKILVCLEIDEHIVDEAIKSNADMIVCHHPIIFTPLKSMTYNEPTQKLIIKLIKNNISLYAAHTNFDSADGGMNDVISEIAGIKNTSVLSNDKAQSIYKVNVFVPHDYTDKVRDAILDAGAGAFGAYSHCSFKCNGESTFMPLEGSNPFIGEQGRLERVNEDKIETIVVKKNLDKCIKAMLDAHPYEVPAYDITPITMTVPCGIGRYGCLEKPVKLEELAKIIKSRFKAPYAYVAGDRDRIISSAAIVGGSGIDFAEDAIRCGCDVLITGDVKHHQAQDAVSKGLCIIDIGHYYSENAAMPYLADMLSSELNIECFTTLHNTCPFTQI